MPDPPDAAPVLLVDDTPANLLALEAVLAAPGWELVRAATAREALRLLAGREFAVVLLDLRLPDLDGFEAARRLRALPRHAHTPVIFLTADASDFPAEEAYTLGAVDYLLKPVVPVILRAKVTAFVDLYRKAERIRELERRERDRAEEARRAAEGRLRAVVEAATDHAILATDPAGLVTYWSAGAERLFGWAEGEILGETADVIFTPEDRAAGVPDQERSEAAETGRATDERWHLRKDGSRFFASGVMTPIRDGRLHGFTKVARDITDRVREQEALRDREALLRSIGDNLPAGAVYQVTATPDGGRRFNHISAGVERVFGVPAAEVLADANALYGLILPEDAPRVAAAEEAALAAGGPFDCEFRSGTRAGDVRWLHARSAPRELPGGAVAWDGIILDVTARKAAEERVARDAQLLANVSDAVVVTDPDGVVTFWNDGAARLFGWTAGEVVGRHYTDRIPDPAARAWIREQIRERVAGSEWAGEYEDVRKDGSRVWIDARVRRITDAAGRVVGVMGVSRDISDRKRLEADLRRRAEELADRDRKKDEFLAVLGHELRNPLAPVRNGLHILGLLADQLPPVARQTREVMDRQVGYLVRLVDDLLDVSRITRGKVELRRQAVDLRDVARAAAETSQPLVTAGRHELGVELPADPVWVDGDPARLTQVVANLLNNAAKYTPPGGCIRVAVEADGGGAAVRVADTGIGIAPDMLPRVFDLFAQADQARDRAQGGLGIGLTLVRQLVELHGGTVEAHSDGPGRGSEFVVRLPTAAPPSA